MSNIPRYAAASDGSAPSPLVWDQIPLLEIMQRPSAGYGFYDDFINGFADDSSGTTVANWIADYVGAAGVFTPGNAAGGGVIFDPSDVDGRGLQISKQEFVLPAAGTKIAFGASVSVGDADDCDLFVGLTTIDTDILGSNANDVLGFIVADGSANINYLVRKGGSGDATDTTADLANETTVRLEAVIDDTGSMKFYVDGALKITSTSGNIDTGEEMSFAIGYLVGASTATATATVNWAYCYQWSEVD